MQPKLCALSLLVVFAPFGGLCDSPGYAPYADSSVPSLRGMLDTDASVGDSKRRLNSVISWFAVQAMGLVVEEDSVERFGTTFTADNYQRDMIDFLIAGRTNDNGLAAQAWNVKGTGQTVVTAGLVRPGPGPNTTTHLGFDDVQLILSQYPSKIEAGLLERGNELGMQILGSGAWPEAPGGIKSIGLGQTKENHAFARPYLANALDKGNWSDAWLLQKAAEFFNERHKVESSDTTWWVAQLLHKIHLDLEIDANSAKEFASYMSSIILLIPFSEESLKNFIVEKALSAQATLAKKAAYLETLKDAVRRKYAHEDFVSRNDEAKIGLLASIILDSLQFAGGISVPSVLNYVLGLTHMASDRRPESLKDLRLSSGNYQWILWETLRRYAPVAGVPSWEKRDDGSFKHVVPKLTAALQDTSVFPNPLEFKNRGADVYENKLRNTGLPWAGPAVSRSANGVPDTAASHSHNCPAQDLSFRIMKAFLLAFIDAGGASGWSAVDESISVNAYAASSFTLLKRGHTQVTDCAYFPACDAGYSWVSTSYCSWGRRVWTCQVL